MRPIVFLHIPKTAGQSIHNALLGAVGAAQVSPVRVHTQVGPGESQFPPGYRLYSGHLDWTDLDAVPDRPFVFSVLRDPLERIASFYLYLRDKAKRADPGALAEPQNLGLRTILERSADDYFFGGSPDWTRFILDHYDNVYCSYFATRRMRGHHLVRSFGPEERLDQAGAGLKGLDGVYSTSALEALERDLDAALGIKVAVRDRIVNAGPEAREARRWPKLAERLERDGSEARLLRFAELDRRLLDRIGLQV